MYVPYAPWNRVETYIYLLHVAEYGQAVFTIILATIFNLLKYFFSRF